VLISTIAATLAGAITYLAHMMQWAAFFGGGRSSDDEEAEPVAMLLLAILAPFAAMLVQLAVSRAREYQADASGARLAGRSSGLAKALEKARDGRTAEPMPANRGLGEGIDSTLHAPGNGPRLERREQVCQVAGGELAATETLAEAGLVPKEAAAAIRARAKIDVAQIHHIEARVKHDVIAFTMAVGESIGDPAAARWLHYGMTSNDVVDTAQASRFAMPRN